jgi:signal peptidase II
MYFYVTALFVFIVDQISKILIRLNLPEGDSVVIWEGILHFTHYENSGAAGSSFQGYGRWFIIPAILVIIFVIRARKKGELRGFVLETGSAFFVGGAAGNMIDRILFNQVTDFLDFQYGRGILNMADVALNIGVLFFVLNLFGVGSKKAE